ncbi:MAG: hypothetical protein ACD_19C00016G0004 [uncultured bacterium]|nr:MAG: hypothetical protein ACD_19C00016G0004 [uncultured bacterium]
MIESTISQVIAGFLFLARKGEYAKTNPTFAKVSLTTFI